MTPNSAGLAVRIAATPATAHHISTWSPTMTPNGRQAAGDAPVAGGGDDREVAHTGNREKHDDGDDERPVVRDAEHLEFPAHEEFEQRFLRVQAVLRLVPHHRLRAIDHRRGDFLAAVRRQAVHEKRVLLRRAHHFRVHLPVVEVAPALLVLRLEAHRGPHVRGDQVGAARAAIGSAKTSQLRLMRSFSIS